MCLKTRKHHSNLDYYYYITIEVISNFAVAFYLYEY